MKSLRCVIIDEVPIVRHALSEEIARVIDSPEVVYEGEDISDALAAVQKRPVDLILAEVALTDGSSPLDNVRALAETGASVIVFSALSDSSIVRESIDAGAHAYVTKYASVAQVSTAITTVLNGEGFISPDIAVSPAATRHVTVKLSDQERTALSLYASGLKMEAVSRRMGVSVTTAQEYIKRVRSKFRKAGYEVSTKTDLYRVAKQRGLIT